MRARDLLIAMCLVILTGCQASIATTSERAEATRLAALLERHGITAETSRAPGGGWQVEVPETELPAARQVVAAYQLPPGETPPEPGFAPIAGAVHHRATERELELRLATSIGLLDGVHDARVHLGLPRTDWSAQEAPEAGTASILVLKDADADTDRLKADIYDLVAGGIDSLGPENITLVQQAVVPPELDEPWERVGPWRVGRGTAGLLQWCLGLGLFLIVAMTGTIAWGVVRSRRTT